MYRSKLKFNLSKYRVLDFLSPTTSSPHLPHLSNDPTSHSDSTAKKPGVIFAPLSSLLHIQVFRKSSICTKTSWVGSFLHLHFHHHWADIIMTLPDNSQTLELVFLPSVLPPEKSLRAARVLPPKHRRLWWLILYQLTWAKGCPESWESMSSGWVWEAVSGRD